MNKHQMEIKSQGMIQAKEHYGETPMNNVAFSFFCKGAQWEHNRVWHLAEKTMPEYSREIIVIDKKGNILGFGKYMGDGFYESPYTTLRLYLSSVSLWAYMKDLAPMDFKI